MTFTDWVQESRRTISERGLRAGGAESARKFHYGALRKVEQTLADSGFNVGENVFDRQWDVLAIADGCRYDLMAETAPEYEFLDSCSSMTSVAGGSLSWMERTFGTGRDVENVAYVTANPFSSRVLQDHDFAVMDEVWTYSWSEELGTVRAETVTESAIDTLRAHDWDRAIVHYMQPHHPFVPNPLAAGINRASPEDHDTTVWEKLRDGDLGENAVWEGYRENLRYVLNAIDDLRLNVDGPRLAVTADHGNALGEAGIYGHGDYPLPSLRRVPWCTGTATDEHTIEPTVTRRETDIDVEDQLRDLGYR
jgi:hypothetical protein